MKTLIIRAIGRPTDAWQTQAIHMYQERLELFSGVDIIELPEGHGGAKKPDGAKTRSVEASALLKGIPKDAFLVALDEQGASLPSPSLARKLEDWSNHGQRPVVFLIGGSWGLDASIRERTDAVLSFGPMTLPHNLARIVLLEQLYRARMIAAGREYHK